MTIHLPKHLQSLGRYNIPQILKSENPEEKLEEIIDEVMRGKSEAQRKNLLDEIKKEIQAISENLREEREETIENPYSGLKLTDYMNPHVNPSQRSTSIREDDLEKIKELEKFLPQIVKTAREHVREFSKRNFDFRTEQNSMISSDEILSAVNNDLSDIESNTVNIKIAKGVKPQDKTLNDQHLKVVTVNGARSGEVIKDVNEDGYLNYDDIIKADELARASNLESGNIFFWNGENPEIMGYNPANDSLVLKVVSNKKLAIVNLGPVTGNQIRFSLPLSEEKIKEINEKYPPNIARSIFGGHQEPKSVFEQGIPEDNTSIRDRLKVIPDYKKVAELHTNAVFGKLDSSLVDAYQVVVDEIYKVEDDAEFTIDQAFSVIDQKLANLKDEKKQKVWANFLVNLSSINPEIAETFITNNITRLEKSMGFNSSMSDEKLAALDDESKAILLTLENFTPGLFGGNEVWVKMFGDTYTQEELGKTSSEGEEEKTYFKKGPWSYTSLDEIPEFLDLFHQFSSALPGSSNASEMISILNEIAGDIELGKIEILDS